ncbi:uncharacterized protein UHOR_14761 [Ustilago hordei]|uniref:Uncharacterized protein n=1 Tax=Ustilago hordei TaxID=120017 RepID=I2FVV3_USTHO|nr:uncharacterized protein UHOR_14761 [Ustilago hordei]
MVTSPYQTRSKTVVSTPHPKVTAAPSHRCRIMVWLCSHKGPVAGTSPPASPIPARVADPLASPVALSPLEPLFLGMDDDTIIPSPLPSPFLACAVDLYMVDARHPAVEMMMPEHQATWEAKLAWTPTLPPDANDIVDAVLVLAQAATLEYCPNMQPLTPPPHWVGCWTPPPPPPNHHLPMNGEIAGWAEQFVVVDLVAQIADCHFPLDWDVPIGSLPERHLHCLVMLCCFASAFTNLFGEQHRIPCACTHCYLAGLGHCECTFPAHLGMEHWGDRTPSLQPCGSHQTKQAHLMVADGYGPGFIWLEEQVLDPVMTPRQVMAMQVVWHLPNPSLVSSILQTLQVFMAHHNNLYSEHQLHELVMVSGGSQTLSTIGWLPRLKNKWLVRFWLPLLFPQTMSTCSDIAVMGQDVQKSGRSIKTYEGSTGIEELGRS